MSNTYSVCFHYNNKFSVIPQVNSNESNVYTNLNLYCGGTEIVSARVRSTKIDGGKHVDAIRFLQLGLKCGKWSQEITPMQFMNCHTEDEGGVGFMARIWLVILKRGFQLRRLSFHNFVHYLF